MAKYQSPILSKAVEKLKESSHTDQQITTYLERLICLPMSRLTVIVNAEATPKIERALCSALISMAAAGEMNDVLNLLVKVQ